MQLIRCTGKLQKEMGVKKTDLVEGEPTFSFMGQWHTNLIYINKKKCVLFTNDKTLFNFIVTDVSRAEIKELSKMFIDNFYCILADEGIEQETINKICQEYGEVRYAKTSSKSVLGSMNDLAFHYKFLIQEAGSVYSHLVPGIIKQLNRMPMGPLKYRYPIEALKALYEI